VSAIQKEKKNYREKSGSKIDSPTVCKELINGGVIRHLAGGGGNFDVGGGVKRTQIVQATGAGSLVPESCHHDGEQTHAEGEEKMSSRG